MLEVTQPNNDTMSAVKSGVTPSPDRAKRKSGPGGMKTPKSLPFLQHKGIKRAARYGSVEPEMKKRAESETTDITVRFGADVYRSRIPDNNAVKQAIWRVQKCIRGSKFCTTL